MQNRITSQRRRCYEENSQISSGVVVHLYVVYLLRTGGNKWRKNSRLRIFSGSAESGKALQSLGICQV